MKSNKILVIFLMFIPIISGLNFTYTVDKNDVTSEIYFNSSITFELPVSYSELESNTTFNLSGRRFLTNQSGYLKFKTSDYIEKGSPNFLILRNIPQNSSVKIYLPEGYYLSDKYFLHPLGYDLETDGKKIIIEWKNIPDKEILVFYDRNTNNFFLYLAILSIVLLSLFLYFKLKPDKNDLTKNLYREEKEIIKYLMTKKDKSAWTKEIIKHLGISKVRFSRKIRGLVERGLVEKEPFGNENLIKLKK